MGRVKSLGREERVCWCSARTYMYITVYLIFRLATVHSLSMCFYEYMWMAASEVRSHTAHTCTGDIYMYILLVRFLLHFVRTVSVAHGHVCLSATFTCT